MSQRLLSALLLFLVYANNLPCKIPGSIVIYVDDAIIWDTKQQWYNRQCTKQRFGPSAWSPPINDKCVTMSVGKAPTQRLCNFGNIQFQNVEHRKISFITQWGVVFLPPLATYLRFILPCTYVGDAWSSIHFCRFPFSQLAEYFWG